ncbi:MAG: homocysteine S-methyltransferase family protein, partial [Armatimonadetes bacterium]|nr:homocysteine S-methyltransferase family protein [Armatimonadota bacterium]
MNIIQSRLDEREILIADGSWGWQLTVRGLPVGQLGETWNLENPDEVLGVAEGYVEAGADIILTNSFQGSPFKLATCGLEERTEEVNRVAAALSRQAAGDEVLVAGSVGPTGEFLQPLGLITESDMVAAFARQIIGLADG